MFIAENRTAECLGIQHVWIVKNVEQKQKKFVANRKITRVRPFRFCFLFSFFRRRSGRAHTRAQGSDDWLSVREFQTTTECLMALREDNR
jgi:hypothetical protein